MTDDPETGPERDSVVIPFPRGRSERLKKPRPPRNLGLTPLSRTLGPHARGAKGRWCDTCQGIWYSYLHETKCPLCINKP